MEVERMSDIPRETFINEKQIHLLPKLEFIHMDTLTGVFVAMLIMIKRFLIADHMLVNILQKVEV